MWVYRCLVFFVVAGGLRKHDSGRTDGRTNERINGHPDCRPTSTIACITCYAGTALVIIIIIITVRRSALHGLCDRNSVRLSGLSVCPSVTLVDCVHIIRPTIMISSPYGSDIILVSGDITIIPKFEGGHPERGR